MTQIHPTRIGMVLALVLLLPAGSGRCQSPTGSDKERLEKAKKAIHRLGGEVTEYYTDPETGLPVQGERAVTFANTELTDEDLVSAGDCLTTIDPKKLDLRLTKVRGSFCGSIKLPKLADLDLSSTLVDDAGLQQIVNPNSTVWGSEEPFRLRLNYVKLSLPGLKGFVDHFKTKGPKSLVLSVSGVTVTNKQGEKVGAACLLEALVGLHCRLTGLNLSNTSLGAADLGPHLWRLARFEKLTRLGLAGNKLTDNQIDHWLKCECRHTKFKALALSDNAVTDKTLDRLAKLDLSELRLLMLSNTRITKGFDALPPLPHLRRLDLKNTYTVFSPPPPGVAFEFITFFRREILFPVRVTRAFPELEVLDVSGTGVIDERLENIGYLPKLTNLELSNTVVTNMGIELLAGLPGSPPLNVVVENTKATPKAANQRLGALRAGSATPGTSGGAYQGTPPSQGKFPAADSL